MLNLNLPNITYELNGNQKTFYIGDFVKIFLHNNNWYVGKIYDIEENTVILYSESFKEYKKIQFSEVAKINTATKEDFKRAYFDCEEVYLYCTTLNRTKIYEDGTPLAVKWLTESTNITIWEVGNSYVVASYFGVGVPPTRIRIDSIYEVDGKHSFYLNGRHFLEEFEVVERS